MRKHVFEQFATLSDIIEQYLPYQQQLLSPQMRALLTNNDQQALFAHQFSLLNQVSNQAVALTLKSDPTLSLADFLSRPLSQGSALSMKESHLVTQVDERYYVLVTFTSQASTINIDAAQALVSQFKQLISVEHIKEPLNDSVEYLYTGAIFYTSEASSTGQFEMALYGGLSLLATLLLIALVYRSALALVATLGLVSVSVAYGYFAISLFYNEINIIAFVFSVTLIWYRRRL